MNNEPNDCPAARLAREAATVARAYRRADEAAANEAAEDLCARMDALQVAASHVQATSALGAFYQALLLYGSTDPQMLWFQDGAMASGAARQIQRFAAALAGFLETSADAGTVNDLRSYYMRWSFEEAQSRSMFLDEAA